MDRRWESKLTTKSRNGLMRNNHRLRKNNRRGRSADTIQEEESNLWKAVLVRAVQDSKSTDKTVRREARAWILDSRTRAYSFHWVMDIIGRGESFKNKLREYVTHPVRIEIEEIDDQTVVRLVRDIFEEEEEIEEEEELDEAA